MISSYMSTTLITVSLVLCLSGRSPAAQQFDHPDSLTPALLNDSTLLYDKQHQSTVWGFLRLETITLLSSDTTLKTVDNQWNVVRLKVALETFTNPAVRNFWLHVIIKDQIENYGIKNTESMMELFYRNSTDSASAREIKELYENDVEVRKEHAIVTYKIAGRFSLDAHVFYPEKFQTGDRRPVIILFHGGSWYQGKPEWMFGSCRRYASLGMVAIAIEYRVYDRHGVTPLECISDAKSAIRWARKNAGELGIDPDKIAAGGFSAGGHLAACAAMLRILDEPNEDLAIRSTPDAMIFLSSCLDPTLDPWFVKQVENRLPPTDCSPSHNVRSGLPPSLLVHGSQDKMCPFWTAEKFSQEMTKVGNRCELHRLEGAEHFFIFMPQYREEVNGAIEEFLSSIEFLPQR